MKAGQTDIEVGTRIRITYIHDDVGDDQLDLADNRRLEGQTGKATHPFPGLMWPRVRYTIGVWLDGEHLGFGDEINLTSQDKFEVIEE